MEVVYSSYVKRNSNTGEVIRTVSTALLNGSKARCVLRVLANENGVVARHHLRRGSTAPFHYWS